MMSHYLVLSFVDVQDANAVAGFTWGFPAITQFLGFTHALERKCNTYFAKRYEVKMSGCAIIANNTEHRVFKNRQNFEFLQSKRTPTFAKDKSSSPPIVEEGKMNMTVSLVIELSGTLPATDEAVYYFEQDLLDLCYSMRLAGGIIRRIRKLTLISTQSQRLLKTIKTLVMPGFILKERQEYLAEHHHKLLENNPDASVFDAWLDFSALKYQAQKIEEQGEKKTNQAQWNYIPKPQKGYLVPLMVGYKAISDLYEAGEVINVRDETVPSRFVEAVHSVGEWQGAHRIQNLSAYIWRYQYLDEHWYLCQQAEQAVDITADTIESVNADEELTIDQALDLLL